MSSINVTSTVDHTLKLIKDVIAWRVGEIREFHPVINFGTKLLAK